MLLEMKIRCLFCNNIKVECNFDKCEKNYKRLRDTCRFI